MATSNLSDYNSGILFAAAKKLAEAIKLTEKSGIPSPELKQTLQEACRIVDCSNGYCVTRSSPLSPLLKNLQKDTVTMDMDRLYDEKKLKYTSDNGMITSAGQVQLLQLLVQQVQAKEVLEVGTFTGFGAIGMAEVLAPGGKVTGIEIEPYFCNYVHKIASDNNLNVEVKEGAALDVLKNLASEGKTYDIIYVDCVKVEYADYYKIIMDNGMLSKDGILACDNVLWGGRAMSKYDPSGEALDAFSEAISLDKRVTSVLLPCYDGLLLIKHRKS